jgi:3-hydroxyisobutyrate dehydrogenase
MGGPMAANLVRAGHDVRGFDLSSSALESAGEAGLTLTRSAADAARDVEVIITMLPSGSHVIDVYSADLVKSAAPGTLFVDCSTIDVASARCAHAIAKANAMEQVDAPVSGGVGGATSGTLTFMLGGELNAVHHVSPILSAMGKRVVHCGEPGTGQAAKICNNLILGVSMIAVSEAFVLGERLGITAQALFDVISTSSGQCWSVTSYCPVPGPVPSSPANHGYRPGFATNLMVKDLELARDAARTANVQIVLGRQAAELYAAYQAAGFGTSDFSGYINYIREHGG